MKLYFVRHATASNKTTWSADDDLRPLTRTGRKRFAVAVHALVKAGALRPDIIVTSPLVRAEQTAQLLGEALGGGIAIATDARLGHDFDVTALEGVLADHDDVRSIAIVGHNPSFSGVLSEAIGGASLDMRKGAIALVELDTLAPPAGRLLWLAPPTIFPGCP